MIRRLRSVRLWQGVHRWSSLICTLFFLVLCITGLPLIFEQEIDHWLDPEPPYAALPAGTPMANLDEIVRLSRQRYPGQIITSLFVDDDEPRIIAALAPSWETDPDKQQLVTFDARTAQIRSQSAPAGRQPTTFLDVMVALHVELFAGLPGQLFLAVIGVLLVTALVSGVVLYGPFTRTQRFGAVRTDRSRRVRWLDLHNVLGVVTLAWALVVGATGIMNELSTVLFAVWQRSEAPVVLRPYQGQPAVRESEMRSVQAAFRTAQDAVPGMIVTSVVFPGDPDGSPYHYLIWAHGPTPLTARLFSPVLVDARTGALTAVLHMPWYLRVLEVCRPLHFGDYGGVPLKVIWALFDLVTIVVLGSGVYLWLSRRPPPVRVGAAAGRPDHLDGATLGVSRVAP